MADLSYSNIPSGIMDMLSRERARVEQSNQAAAEASARQAARIAQISQQAVQPQQAQPQSQIDPAMMEFGQYKYNAELQPKLQDYTNRYNQLNSILQADQKQASFVKNNLELLDKQFKDIKPFEETQQYKLSAESPKSAEITK